MSKVVLWVSDLDSQMSFYANLLGLAVDMRDEGFAELSSAVNSVLLHELPIEYRAAVPLIEQLPAQDEVAIKPVFLVEDTEAARDRVKHSLATFPRDEVIHGAAKYLDVVDPEGNVIQLEQRF
jgi:catechol 2,3-dioxygenase-like lactoylglutathione lyase family enzyme